MAFLYDGSQTLEGPEQVGMHINGALCDHHFLIFWIRTYVPGRGQATFYPNHKENCVAFSEKLNFTTEGPINEGVVRTT